MGRIRITLLPFCGGYGPTAVVSRKRNKNSLDLKKAKEDETLSAT